MALSFADRRRGGGGGSVSSRASQREVFLPLLSMAGMAASNQQPPVWRPCSFLPAGARRVAATKWCVPGGSKASSSYGSLPDLGVRASAPCFSAATLGGRRRIVVVMPRDPIAFSSYVLGCFLQDGSPYLLISGSSGRVL
jgi:hypothetical protein